MNQPRNPPPAPVEAPAVPAASAAPATEALPPARPLPGRPVHPAAAELQALLAGPLHAAVRAAADYAGDATAAVTQAAYRRDWAEFAAWCREHDPGTGNGTGTGGADPAELPINPVLVAAWLATLADSVGSSALRRRVAAIAHHHRRRGMAFSGAHPVIRETLAGIARRHGKPKRPAAALTSTEIRRLLDACPDDITGTRDRALLLVGFAGAFRRSELVAIDVEHLRFDGNGRPDAAGVTIRVPRNKRDQAGKGADVVLPRMHDPETGRAQPDLPRGGPGDLAEAGRKSASARCSAPSPNTAGSATGCPAPASATSCSTAPDRRS